MNVKLVIGLVFLLMFELIVLLFFVNLFMNVEKGDMEGIEDSKVNIVAVENKVEFSPEKEIRFSPSKLTENRYWDNFPIQYSIDKACGEYQTIQVQNAFKEIEMETNGVVSFRFVDFVDEGISVSCEYISDCYKRTVKIEEGYSYHYEEICEHTKGTAQITQIVDSEIKKAQIKFFGFDGFAETAGEGASGFYVGTCGDLNTEIHEILHTFGYGHEPDEESIMYFQEEGVSYSIFNRDKCKGKAKKIDDNLILDLINTYSSSEPTISGQVFYNLGESNVLIGTIFFGIALFSIIVIIAIKFRDEF